MIYHDMDRQFMIWLVLERKNDPPTFRTEFLEAYGAALNQYQLRIVTSWDELTEKIRIFEERLDDTIIEFFKRLATGNALGKAFPPGSPEFEECTAWFVRCRETPLEPVLEFKIFRTSNYIATTTVPLELYQFTERTVETQSGKNRGVGELRIVNKASKMYPAPGF